MPFTKEQLKDVDFYQDFVTELQRKYLDRVDELKQENFRRNDVLYSFEDIISTNGLEDSTLGQDTIYNGVIGDSDIENMLSMSDNQYPVYVSDSLLEKTIDRNITELAQSEFADRLPRYGAKGVGTRKKRIENGDIVTSDDFEDKSIFLILNNQKRLFDDIGIFYAEYDVSKLKTVPVEVLDSIPSGEAVEWEVH